MSAPDFSAEELQRQAQGNANAFMLVTMAYLKRTGGSVASWTNFAGEQLAPGWRELADADAAQLARIWALNFASVGGAVELLAGDAHQATVVVSNWPSDEDLRDVNLTREDIDPFFNIGNNLLRDIGATITWSREGNRSTFIITK